MNRTWRDRIPLRWGLGAMCVATAAWGQSPNPLATTPSPNPLATPVETLSDTHPEGKPFSGILKALGSGRPLGNVTVTDLSDEGRTAESLPNGQFTIFLSPDSKGVKIQAQGFEDLELTWTKGEIPTKAGEWWLEPAPQQEVVGVIRARRKTEVSQQTVDRKTIERIPGGGNDAVRSLQTLPSVLPVSSFNSALVVRGSGAQDNGFYLDKIEVPFVFHLGGLGTVFPTRVLDAVDFYAGGYSAVYGNATGGIVQLRTESNVPERTSGQFDLSAIQASLYMEGQWGGKPTSAAQPSAEGANGAAATATDSSPIGWRFGLRRSYLEIWTPVIKKVATSLNFVTLPQITDWQLMLNGKKGNATWQTYSFGAYDKLSLAAETNLTSDENGKTQFALTDGYFTNGVRWSQPLGDGWIGAATLWGTVLRLDQKFFDYRFKLSDNLVGLNATVEKRVSPQAAVQFGFNPMYDQVHLNYLLPQVPATVTVFDDFETFPLVEDNRTLNAFYWRNWIDVLWNPSASLLVNPGLTLIKGNPGVEAYALDPRVLIRQTLAQNITLGGLRVQNIALKAAIGQYSKLPEPQYIIEGYGNPKLKPEQTIQQVLGFEAQVEDVWSIDVQAWKKDFSQLVGRPVVDPSNRYENSGEGRAWGLETLIKRDRLGRFQGWVGYGWAKAERKDPLTGVWRPFDFDRRHNLNAVGSWKLTGRWEVSGKMTWISGAPHTSCLTGGIKNTATGRYRCAPDGEVAGINKNESRLPDTYRLDLRTDYEQLFETWKIDWYFELLNATNHKNVEGVQRSPDFKSETYAEGLPIFPNFGVQATF